MIVLYLARDSKIILRESEDLGLAWTDDVEERLHYEDLKLGPSDSYWMVPGTVEP